MTGLGGIAGIVFGVVAHGQASGTTRGWTLYTAESQRYADYLPTQRAAWFPGLAEYALAGLLVGLLVALLVAGLGFRMARVRRATPSRSEGH